MSDTVKARLRWSILTLLGVGILGGLFALALFAGGFDTAADYPWPQPVTWAIHQTMINSTSVRAGGLTPPQHITPAEVTEGFRLYDQHCAMCHGGPGLGREPWTSGLEPTPPYLIDVSRRFSRPELYRIIHDGVRMTAMPAWRSRISSADTWSVVAFLEALPNLTASDYARMRVAWRPPGGGGEPKAPATAPVR